MRVSNAHPAISGESIWMDKATAVERLGLSGLTIRTEERLNNDTGWCLRLEFGAIVNCYDSGKVDIQGKNQNQARAALDLVPTGAPSPAAGQSAISRKVFVVYGHDGTARTELEAMLRRWGLEPLILDQLTSGGQTIIEKLDSVRRDANFAVDLATPDDEGNRKCHPEEKALRARQNVVLELGMMLATLGRESVAILVKSDVAMERPSDIQGLLYIQYKENVADAKLLLAKEINAQGIRIDLGRV